MLSDPLEGYPTLGDILHVESMSSPKREALSIANKKRTEILRTYAYVSCWCQSATENDFMWKAYGTSAGGVLVQTRFGKLVRLLPKYVSIGKVIYVSDTSTSEDGDRRFQKLEYYRFENEIRATFFGDQNPCWDAKYREEIESGEDATGFDVKVNLTELVETVVVQPDAPDWVVRVVQEVSKRYHACWPIDRSALCVTGRPGLNVRREGSG